MSKVAGRLLQTSRYSFTGTRYIQVSIKHPYIGYRPGTCTLA